MGLANNWNGNNIIVIVCAGEELTPRWNNYLGVTRHMIPVSGMPLIHRIQNQLLSRGITDIILMCDQKRKESYIFNSTVTHIIPPERTDDIRFNSVVWTYRNYINKLGNTVFLFGDTYYTEEFMDHLVDNIDENLLIYRRVVKQYPYQNNKSESFAIVTSAHEASIYVDYINEITPDFIKWVDEKKNVPAGLANYINGHLHKVRSKHGIANPLSYRINWSDLTDDFDYPCDWDLKHKYFPEIFTKPNES